MKNNYLRMKLAFALLLCFSLFYSCKKEETAEIKTNSNVSINDAKLVALKMSSVGLSGSILKSGSASEKEIKEISIIHDLNNDPDLYIVNFKPEGFVIISATKKEIPILAFSSTSNFNIDNIPSEIQEWINTRKEKIEALKGNTVQIPIDLEEKWLGYVSPPPPNTGDETDDPYYNPEIDPSNPNYITMRVISKGPLLVTTWSQGDGYNNALSPINGTLPPAGCVATAMGQVMRYHQYPTTYNWSVMPNATGSAETARLMLNIGTAVIMNYDIDISTTTLGRAADAFKNVFGYSSFIKLNVLVYNTVVNQINNNQPVILEGYTSSNYANGHAWVCDGYYIREFYRNQTGTVTSREEYLHMNWGFENANGNGYYEVGNFTVNMGNGISMNFKYSNNCIFNIKPDIGIIL